MNNILLEKNKLEYDENILNIKQTIKNYCKNNTITKIFINYKYEKIIPLNFWFKDNNYKIYNRNENNQNMRIRFYNNKILTPLVATSEDNLKPIKSLLEYLSLYQPYYPESFFSMWEFLSLDFINSQNLLFICGEKRFGSIEASLLYNEINNSSIKKYDVWKIDGEIFNTNDIIFETPTIDYLGQTYKINYIKSSKQLDKYDFIYIDNISQLDSICEWVNEEKDFQALLFYFLTSLEILNPSGNILIRLNILSKKYWTVIFEFVDKYFKEHIFYRSKIINPFNSEIFLLLKIYEPKHCYSNIYINFLKSLYKNKVYEILNIGHEIISNNIFNNYVEMTKKWISDLDSYINSPNENQKDYVSSWYKKHNLKQIRDTNPGFKLSVCEQNLETLKRKYIIKPVHHYDTLNNQYYSKIIKSKGLLNYYKRVMDTKPSRIFNSERYEINSQEYFLTWDNLTYKLDMYKKIKRSLKNDFQTEMITNAWIKMYEILHQFPTLIPDKIDITTFHLCEAPGAFISATNHYLDKLDKKLNWYSQTLNPKNHNIALDDHYGLISKYPEKWIYGDPNGDETGDITHSDVIKYYKSLEILKDVDFMTADAGILCKGNELNNQESILSKVNMGQIICILSCLPKNKSAVFKTFLPMSEPLTISLMYLLTIKFNHVTLFKPMASNSSNSEIYVILEDFKGISSQDLNILYILLDDPKITNKTLLFENISEKFMKSYSNSITKLIERQIYSLNRNYYYYFHLDEIDYGEDNLFTNQWFDKYPVVNLKNKLLS
ncbi:ftsj-like methyltransferase [Moumouvirus maliensis]|nr:ftsj-like methyltransferase [Moumouvirus maliensis]